MWFHGGMTKRVESHVYQHANVPAMQDSRQTRSSSKNSEQMRTNATSQVRLHGGMSKRVESHVYQVTNVTAQQSTWRMRSKHMGTDATPQVRLWCCLDMTWH